VRYHPTLPALAVLALSVAPHAATGSDPAPHEYLDQETAATVIAAAKPLVFANPRTELAANARDYVTLAAAAVDRSGKMTFVWVAYFWSTVDPRMRREPLVAPARMVLEADDRRIEVALHGGGPHDAGIGMPVDPPPGPAGAPSVYGTELETLRFIAAARRVAVLIDSHGTQLSYGLWDDQRRALQALVRRIDGG
jgi:hypothetical protein